MTTLETLNKNTRVSWTNETVEQVVNAWNWNSNIFEIYDQVRDWDKNDQKVVLEYAYHFFGKDKMINELASFLLGWGFE